MKSQSLHVCILRVSALDNAAKKGRSGKEFDRILVQYYIAYGNGEFVDRAGGEIGGFTLNGGLSNDTITGIAAVFWEALFDYWADMPVFVDASGKRLTAKEPTALKEKIATARPVDAAIDEGKVRIIRGVSNFAGEQASAGSAAAFGFLGKINIGFVLTPGFSIGDNDTLMEVVKTSAGRATRRGTEIALYFGLSSQQNSIRNIEAAAKK